MLGGLDRLLRITSGLMCLPHWELGTLEGAHRRFEGFGELQDLFVGLLRKVDGPAKALADVVSRLVIYLANIVLRVKEVNAHRNAMRDRPQNPRAFGLEPII